MYRLSANGRTKLAPVLALAMLASLAFGAPGYAQVKPGDFITPENAGKVKTLLPPGVFYKVERVDWPPPYKDATEKYSGQVRLSDDHRSLVGYVSGQPFPLIDSNDPYVGAKIIWNNVFRPITSDDYDLRFYDCDTEYQAKGAMQQQVEYFQIGHYAGYQLVGRTEVEPIPVDPDFKNTGRYWIFGLYPVLAPNELRGIGFIRWRYANPKKGDDTWSLTSKSRRVRRVDESILSSAVTSGTAAFSWDPDHYSGFNPKTEEYDYKYLGEKSMLGCVHAAHSPEVRCATDGGASACPEDWEMRHMYTVEATPRPGHINAIDARTMIYLDSEMWFEPFIDTYDRSGQ